MKNIHSLISRFSGKFIGLALLAASFLIYVWFLPGQITGPGKNETKETYVPGRPFYQYSTVGALMAGLYQGRLTIGELGLYGDMGLGTYNRLNGEMAALDGDFYRILSDGRVEQASDGETTPFAQTVFFRPDETMTLPPSLDYAAFKKFLDGRLDNRNAFLALRIDGVFPYLKLASMPAQTPPYKPLREIIGEQKTFEYKELTGTLMGFRTPSFMGSLGIAGYHFHFLSDDRQKGGHLVELETGTGQLSYETFENFHLVMPDTADFRNADLGHFSGNDMTHIEDSRKE